MKLFRFTLICLMVLGLGSALWSLDFRASLSKDATEVQAYQLPESSWQPESRANILSQNFNTYLPLLFFLTSGWKQIDVDGGDTQWGLFSNPRYGNSGNSAGHDYSTVGMQEGWLITPRLRIPSTSEDIILSFKNISSYPSFYPAPEDGGHYVMINATSSSSAPATTDPGWRQLWREERPSSYWTDIFIQIPPEYTGQRVYVAFVYKGDDASGWFIDNVDISTGHIQNLTIQIDPPGGGTTIPDEGISGFPLNYSAPLIATPGFGHTWDRWDGAVDNPTLHRTSITMNQDHTIQAGFTPYPWENLFVQQEIGGAAYTSAFDSNGGLDLEVAEYFSGPVQTIEKMVFHTLATNLINNTWVEWLPADMEHFTVRFYEGGPTEEPDWGSPIYNETFQGKVFSIGPVWGFTGYKVELDLPNNSDLTLGSGWVSVQCNVDAGSGGWMLLLSSEDGSGDGTHYLRAGDESELSEDDIYLELWGSKSYAPIITHLPLINTPITNQPYTVQATITSEIHTITAANLYYSVDAGFSYSGPITMTPLGDDIYQGQIPPTQGLDITVSYYLEAIDSDNNITTAMSPHFQFLVANPVWLYYDTGIGSFYGTDESSFGVAVEYENPFFGTGFPLWLLAVDGMFYDDNVTARLVIFELNEAGTTWEGIVGGYVTFPTGQQFHAFDLEEHDVLINSQYFMVGYLDIPADNYFLFDKTFNYNTSYAYLDGILYYQPGCWSIGALITNGMPETLDAPHITIVLDGYPKLLWDPVLAALSYYVYGSNDPYTDLEDWTLLDIVSATSPLEYYFQDDDEFQFFLVIATTDDPAKRHGIATRITPHHIIQTPNLTHNLKNSLRKANSTGTLLPLQQHR